LYPTCEKSAALGRKKCKYRRMADGPERAERYRSDAREKIATYINRDRPAWP